MKIYHFLILLVSSFGISAQITLKDAALHTQAGGPKIMDLGEGMHLYTGAADGSWFYARGSFMVLQTDVEGEQIASGAEIFDMKGQSLGNIGVSVKVVEKAQALGRKHRDKWVVILEGYVLKTRLKEDSHPELALEQILQSKGQINDEINQWIKTFKAKRFDKDGQIQYVIYEENYTLEDEKSFRIILHYKDASRLMAVTTHRQKLHLPKVKFYVEDQEFHHYFPASKPTDKDLQLIKDISLSYQAL